MASTHRHRHVRGRVPIGRKWVTVAQLSACYTPEMAALFGRLWTRALGALGQQRPYPIVKGVLETAFSRRPREPFHALLPRVVSSQVSALSGQGDGGGSDLSAIDVAPLDPEMVAVGRAEEFRDISLRESLADTLRDGDPVLDRQEFQVSASMRQALVQAQWNDPNLAPICHTLQYDPKAQVALGKSKTALSLRLNDEDWGLEALVRQANGESSWVVVVPDGLYRPGGSWKSFIFEHFHVGPFGGHKSADRTVMMIRRVAYWEHIVTDVERGVQLCWVCIKFRNLGNTCWWTLKAR